MYIKMENTLKYNVYNYLAFVQCVHLIKMYNADIIK